MPTDLGTPTDLGAASPDKLDRIETLLLMHMRDTAEALAQHSATLAALIEAVTGKPHYLLKRAPKETSHEG